MPKKKIIVSGFSLLMKELQDKYAKEGQKIPMSKMKDFADPVWKAMSVEEKAIYTQRAKGHRRVGTTEKLASDGTSIQHNIEIIEEEEQRERQMRYSIRELINANEQDIDLFKSFAVRQTFYIMSFNILCCTDEGVYVPLEVSIAEYSIQKGIHRHYHKLIYPGRVPTGFTGEAKRHSEDTHQIPFTGVEDSERDYRKIIREIAQFFSPLGNIDEDFPPVFCLRDSMEQTYGCLAWLCGKADFRNFPRVWDLSYLLLELRAGASESLPSVIIAQELLMKNTFDYTLDTRCDFHENLDSAHCALGCVRRLCFLLSDCLCGVFNVDLTEKHLPVRSLETKPYEIYHPVLSSKSSKFSNQSWSRPTAANNSKSSHLFDIDDSSDDDNCGPPGVATTTKTYLKPISPTSAMAQLKLSSAVAQGQGIGRGRLRKDVNF